MSPIYMLTPVLLPMLAGAATALIKGDGEGRRCVRNAIMMAALIAVCAAILPILFGSDMELTLFTLSDKLPIKLRADITGKVFSALICLIWTMAGLYSVGYMKHEQNHGRFCTLYLLTLGVLMALSFAGTIVTFYMLFECMTLLTFPLVMHSMKRDAVAAGIKYLIYSIVGASLVLMGVFMLSPYVSTFDFVPGGVLNAEKLARHSTAVLIAAFLMLVGFGAKAGMFPLHGWLPTAHPAAPSPASAVLSGIITKAGVLGALRVIYFFVGADTLRGSWVQTAFMSLALFTVFMGSMLAYREKLLKKRLAYSSVSQVSYVMFGLSTLNPIGLTGALLHVVCHALIKDVLFMSAGAVIERTGATRVDELDGVGKRMPVTMWCFTLASVGLVGIPPCMGFISKWYLAQGALNMTGVASSFSWLAPAVLLVSALLTAGYLLPISTHGFFPPRDAEGAKASYDNCEASASMLTPMIVLTALSIALGAMPGGLIALLERLIGALM